jgi:hypothetical protein
MDIRTHLRSLAAALTLALSPGCPGGGDDTGTDGTTGTTGTTGDPGTTGTTSTSGVPTTGGPTDPTTGESTGTTDMVVTSTGETTDGSTTSTADTTGTSGTSDATGTTDASTGGDPAPPMLGPQIDRAGRPLVNLALNHTFDPDAAQRDTARDAWNADADPANWQQYAPDLAESLAIFDGLETLCGNQLLVDLGSDDPTRYGPLAALLADDRLYIDTAAATCDAYLGVELDALDVMANTDCGGRRLPLDVVDFTYSALIFGMTQGVGDGVPVSAAAQGAMFPYLAPPL